LAAFWEIIKTGYCKTPDNGSQASFREGEARFGIEDFQSILDPAFAGMTE